MDLSAAISTSTGSVVIVDDHFAPPVFEQISAEALTRHYNFLNDNPEKCVALAKVLGLEGGGQGAERVANEAFQKASSLWEGFKQGAHADLLEPLLGELAETEQLNRRHIDELVKILETHFNVRPLTFATLDAARESLKTCIIAFVDYLIDEKINEDDAAIAQHLQVKAELETPYSYAGQEWPKLIFLISSKLPTPTGLEAFRNEMGIKAAFFIALDKREINKELMTRCLNRLIAQYAASAQLNGYLNTLISSIHKAAHSVEKEIARLELHDLTAVHWLRLDVDSESIQSYLTWLISEAMAVKFRAGAIQTEAPLPKPDEFPLLDGKLLPRSVLFELFSEIAGGPVSENFDSLPLGLGDVLRDLQPDATPRSLLLVISPACDLARCSTSYQVLCVQGVAEEFKSDLSDVLSGRYDFYGKGKFVLKHVEDGQIGYSYIMWSPKQICTLPASELKNTNKYKRVARLSELFTQEIKDLALSHASRVGTQVDPSFCVSLKAVVRMKLNVGQNIAPITFNCDLSAAEYIPAVLAAGRIDEDSVQRTVMFSVQFQDWIAGELDRIAGGVNKNERLDNLRVFFSKKSNLRVPLNDNNISKPITNLLSVKYSQEAPAGEFTGNEMEITLFPYDK